MLNNAQRFNKKMTSQSILLINVLYYALKIPRCGLIKRMTSRTHLKLDQHIKIDLILRINL